MSIFSRAIGAISGSARQVRSVSGADLPAYLASLSKLDKAERGLARKAAAYVVGQGDHMVLSTLSQQGCWLSAGSSVSTRDYPGGGTRQEFLIDPETDVETAIRYVEVLVADRGNWAPERFYLSATDKVPPAIRIYLSELALGYSYNWVHRRDQPLPNLSWQKLVAVAAGLGGRVEDLFDVLFHVEKRYGSGLGRELQKKMDLPAMVRAHPEAFLAQHDRLPMRGRLRLFEFVATAALYAEPPFDRMVVDSLGDGSKAIREAAFKIFRKVHPLKRESQASELLARGRVEMRASMVDVLAGIGSDSARKTLLAHLETEKTGRIRAKIEAYLDAEEEAEPSAPKSANAYRALDGRLVEIPPLRLPENGPIPPVSAETRAALLALGEKLEAKYQTDLKADPKPYHLKYEGSLDPVIFQEHAEKLILGTYVPSRESPAGLSSRLRSNEAVEICRKAVEPYPMPRLLDIALNSGRFDFGFSSTHGIGRLWIGRVLEHLATDEGDLRYIDNGIVETRAVRPVGQGQYRPRRKGDQLYEFYLAPTSSWRPDTLYDQAVWPLVAENFRIVELALGIGNDPEYPKNRLGALEMLETLPALPQRFGGPLVELAMSGPKELRKRARALLLRNAGYEAYLVALINDGRQDVRANAATWLGEIGHAEAVAPLRKRLTKEKSAIAKAAILAALKALGQDISAHIGPDALLQEARKGLEKASFGDVDWLDLESLPRLSYCDGTPLPQEVLHWWIALAVKLKAPGETALFDLYLDALLPQEAVKLSTFLFDAWYGFDTTHPSSAEAESHAQARFSAAKRSWQHWEGREDWSDEQIMAKLRQEKLAMTPNSGAASKGLLALASRVKPSHAVARVRAYLRKHGGRTSQSTALLELMAAKGDPMSLQVVIAAATRLRQKTVQAQANELIQAIAERSDWSMDELSDRTVPTGGIVDDGRLELPCSGGTKVYVARLDEKMGLALFNPEGKPVKSLPGGSDEETKMAKKALSAARKEIKQAVGFQSNRLYEAMCCGRSWAVADWMRDFHGHPLMRKLIEHLIWQGRDGDGKPMAAFRPTAEGEFVDAEDESVDPSRFARLTLAHASTLSGEEAAGWRRHMRDFEVKPLFEQMREGLPMLHEEMREATEIGDRLGWVLDAFDLRSAVQREGYERGETGDGGSFDSYTRSFKGAGIVAMLSFTGNHVEQDNIPTAIKGLQFRKLPKGRKAGYGLGTKLKLGEVPPVLLTECWGGLHRIAGKAAFDPEWEKVFPW